MHICFTVSAMQCGGAEKVVSTLSNEFSGLGHTVSIIMVSENKDDTYYQLNLNVNLYALCKGSESRVNPVNRIKLLRKKILDIKPDIVIAFLPHICVYTWLALKDTCVPYITSERNDPNTYSLVYKVLIRNAFSDADGCVFQTHDALRWYRKKNKLTDRIIPNIVGLTYQPELHSNITKKRNVVFVGRLDEQKNFSMLLKAFSLFIINHPEYTLDVYGDGPEKDTFFSLANELGLLDFIRYHGRSSNWHMDEYNAGLYVSTSDYEGMSNSLLEAATLGIPCVATDCPIGGSKELSFFFHNILLSPVRDEQLFATQMEKALSMDVCFDGINENVSKPVIVKQWLALISQIVLDKTV